MSTERREVCAAPLSPAQGLQAQAQLPAKSSVWPIPGGRVQSKRNQKKERFYCKQLGSKSVCFPAITIIWPRGVKSVCCEHMLLPGVMFG